jgi:hypothetical protein
MIAPQQVTNQQVSLISYCLGHRKRGIPDLGGARFPLKESHRAVDAALRHLALLTGV